MQENQGSGGGASETLMSSPQGTEHGCWGGRFTGETTNIHQEVVGAGYGPMVLSSFSS